MTPETTRPEATAPTADRPPGSARFELFGGKGGVGKTTCAAARAVEAASRGTRVLAISTDPAHSLADAFGLDPDAIDPDGVSVPALEGSLRIVHVAARRGWERWVDRHRAELHAIADGGTYLDHEDIERFLALPAPGIDELVGVLGMLEAARSDRQLVVVDTAPTGHTLRLLESPRALARMAALLQAMRDKQQAVVGALTGRSLPPAPVIAMLERAAGELHALLGDRERTAIRWVTLAEPLAIAETLRALERLERHGLAPVEIVVNRIVVPTPGCATCARRAEVQERALADLHRARPDTPVRTLAERQAEPRGQEALLALGTELREAAPRPAPAAAPPSVGRAPVASSCDLSRAARWLPCLIDEPRRVLFVGGKGGAGKTTCATALAVLSVELSPRPVWLVSSDPAPSLRDLLELGPTSDTVAAGRATVRLLELDAERAFAAWRDRHLEEVARLFDRFSRAGGLAHDRVVLERLVEAPPPGIDELLALARLLEEVEDRPREALTIVDTAPTGHTLRLLEMPAMALEWTHTLLQLLLKYRDAVGLEGLGRQLLELARRLRSLRKLLTDPARCGFVAVVRPGRMVELETERLLTELKALQIGVAALLVNRHAPDRAAAEECPHCGPARALAPLPHDPDREGRFAPTGPDPPCGILLAPIWTPPPQGAAEVAAWGASWIRNAP